jgi:hypothetical protein
MYIIIKGATTFSVTAFSIMTLSIIDLIDALSTKDIQHYDAQH